MSSSPSPFAMPILRFQTVKTTVQKHIQFAQANDASIQPHHQSQQAMAMHGVDPANFLHTFLHSWTCLGATVVAILSILGLIMWTMFKFCSNSEAGLPWQTAAVHVSEKEDYEESLQRTRQLLREMRDDGIDTDIF